VRESKETSPLLAVAGVALILAGTAGLVLGRFRSRRPTPPP
jgi:LPXTG-motif cell wall-anchored protein